jgi:hypothetical protein
MGSFLAALLGIVAGAFVLYLVIWLFILLPIGMARARNRSSVVWVLVSLILSPLVAIIALALLGAAS